MLAQLKVILGVGGRLQADGEFEEVEVLGLETAQVLDSHGGEDGEEVDVPNGLVLPDLGGEDEGTQDDAPPGVGAEPDVAVLHHALNVGEAEDGALVRQALDVEDDLDEFVYALDGGEVDIGERGLRPEAVGDLVKDLRLLELQERGAGLDVAGRFEVGVHGQGQALEQLVDVGGGQRRLQHHGGGGAALDLGLLATGGDDLPLGEAGERRVGFFSFGGHVGGFGGDAGGGDRGGEGCVDGVGAAAGGRLGVEELGKVVGVSGRGAVLRGLGDGDEGLVGKRPREVEADRFQSLAVACGDGGAAEGRRRRHRGCRVMLA